MKKLLFLFSLLLLSSAPADAVLYAVCVGVSEQGVPDSNQLNYADDDATGMYQLLQETTASDNLVLLTDRNATHGNIVAYTQQLFAKAEEGDVVLFFFSGHGGEGIFVTYDTYLFFNTLQQIFKQCKAKRKLIFANACHSGTLRQQSNTTTQKQRQSVGSNVLLFLSSRSDQFSWEVSTLQHSTFTYYLLEGLRGEADLNHDSRITAVELFRFVNPKVKEFSGGQQSPVMWGKFDKNMLIINLK